MPRYHVEGTFPDGIAIPVSKKGAQTCLIVKENNPEDVVTWVHPYITIDNKKLFCIYGAPSPEAIYTAAGRDNMPVDDTDQINVLNRFFNDLVMDINEPSSNNVIGDDHE
jgi:hypothetical protein